MTDGSKECPNEEAASLLKSFQDSCRMVMPGYLGLSLAHDAAERDEFCKRLSRMSANLKATTLAHRGDSHLSCRRERWCEIC
jgi:hypothetical protein